MTTIEAIESEISKLSKPELTKLRNWFIDFDADVWDKQIEQDAATGKLDTLAQEAMAEYNTGKAREL